MDYTEFPRELIYKDRTSLKDFAVFDEMTIEHLFYEAMLKRPSIKQCFKKGETILRIFNNAHYLCTLILMDEDPRLNIDFYRGIAENTERTIDWVNHFAPMTMAMVYVELKGCRKECACGERIFDEFLEEDIYRNYSDWDVKGAAEGKSDFYELAGLAGQHYVKLPSDMPSFPPRTVTIKSIGEAFNNDGYRHSLRYFTRDYDMERIAEIFKYIGRTKEEKEALRDTMRWDVEVFCDEERKPRFLAQLDGMDFSALEHASEQGMEARYSRALLEISIREKKVHELEKELRQLKARAQHAENMLPTSVYHENVTLAKNIPATSSALEEKVDPQQTIAGTAEFPTRVPQTPNGLGQENNEEDEWNDEYDFIFDKKVIPWKIKEAIATVKSEKIKGRRFYYVVFIILKLLKWILEDTSESDFLKWINYHFKCGWENNKGRKKAFLFSLEGKAKKLSDLHPSQWGGIMLYANLGKHYRLLAIAFKNIFTMTMVNGEPVGDSESYEHLIDRKEFLSGAKDIHGILYVSDDGYINDGK